jgi:hypothetical protein
MSPSPTEAAEPAARGVLPAGRRIGDGDGPAPPRRAVDSADRPAALERASRDTVPPSVASSS